MAVRERRAQARAALTPQPTGVSETNLIDARLQRLKLEGTPRPKRERRQPAPPLSPVPLTTEFLDFMLPAADPAAAEVDYETLTQKMMSNIFAESHLGGEDEGRENGVNGDPHGAMRSPVSPSPTVQELTAGTGMLAAQSPISPSRLSRVEEDDSEEDLLDEMDEEEDGGVMERGETP